MTTPVERFNLIIDAVLTSIEKGFIDNPQETKEALEYWSGVALNSGGNYSPHWNDAPAWAEYFAIDADGCGYFYADEPYADPEGGIEMWVVNDATPEEGVTHNPAGYRLIDWRNTLQERPR